MAKKSRESNPNKDYDWVVYPDAFLVTAMELCDSIGTGMHGSLADNGGKVFTKHGFASGHGEYFLIYPIVYNLKHGIELYLKGFGNINHGEFLIIHDLRDLFDYIIGNAKRKQAKILQQLKDDTWPIIKKYYYGTYCPKINVEGLTDIMNEAERYPETQNSYDVSDPYEWVTFDLIADIKDDIKFLETKFSKALRDLWQ